jgi:predicted amidohydrolase YtcJ
MAALVVVDGRIEYAGPKAGMSPPPGAQRIDLTGKYVMPGIINVHCHLGNVKGLVQDPQYFTRANLQEQLRTFASYGVTSVASMGSDADLVYQVRAEQRCRAALGHPNLHCRPRLYRSAAGINQRAWHERHSVRGGIGIEIKKAVAR